MNFHNYQIKEVETARKNLLNKANTGLTAQQDLTLLKQAKELLKIENNLKETNQILEATQKELEGVLQEKSTLSEMLKELSEIKNLKAEPDKIVEQQEKTLTKVAKLLPIEEKLKETINTLECKLKVLEKQVSFLFETTQPETKTLETPNVLLNKVSQILEEKPVNPTL